MGHVVDRVEEPASVGVEEVLHVAADDVQGPAVRDREVPAEVCAPPRQQVIGGRRGRPYTRQRYPEHEVWIGAHAEPQVALARRRHAREISFVPQQVGDDLKVEVRRPSAVLLTCSDRPNPLAAGDRPAALEARQRLRTQVPEERVEPCGLFPGLPGNRVLQDDCRAVVELSGVVPEAVDDAIERRIHGRARSHEHVEADVDGPIFVPVVSAAREEFARIRQPRLVVASNAGDRAGTLNLIEHEAREPLHVVEIGDAGNGGAADTEIEDGERFGSQVLVHDPRESVATFSEPVHDCAGLRAGRKPANLPKRVVRQLRGRGDQLPQQRPDLPLADLQVRVVRRQVALARSHCDAEAQPHADEVVEHRDLGLGEREHSVIAANDGERPPRSDRACRASRRRPRPPDRQPRTSAPCRRSRARRPPRDRRRPEATRARCCRSSRCESPASAGRGAPARRSPRSDRGSARRRRAAPDRQGDGTRRGPRRRARGPSGTAGPSPGGRIPRTRGPSRRGAARGSPAGRRCAGRRRQGRRRGRR